MESGFRLLWRPLLPISAFVAPELSPYISSFEALGRDLVAFFLEEVGGGHNFPSVYISTCCPSIFPPLSFFSGIPPPGMHPHSCLRWSIYVLCSWRKWNRKNQHCDFQILLSPPQYGFEDFIVILAGFYWLLLASLFSLSGKFMINSSFFKILFRPHDLTSFFMKFVWWSGHLREYAVL